MGVAISFVANAVRLLARRSIHDCPCDSDTLLFHDQALRMVDMAPYTRITLRFRRLRWLSRLRWLRRGYRDWLGGRWCRRHGKCHELRPDPTDLFILRPNMIEAT